MTKNDLSVVDNYIENAKLTELADLYTKIKLKINNADNLCDEFQELVMTKGWRSEWYVCPGINGAVFLFVWYDNHYKEFLGYHSDPIVAYNLAAGHALEFFDDYTPTPDTVFEQYEETTRKCLDLGMNSIQVGIKRYHAAIQKGVNTDAAEQDAKRARQEYLREHLHTFVKCSQLASNL